MFDGSLEINPTDLLIAENGIGKMGRVQKTIDSECMRRMSPYMPKVTGNLINSMISSTIIGSGEIEIKSKYAHYLHEGILYVSPTTKSPWAKKNEIKVPTLRGLTYAGAPMRGKKFFDRMKADHRGDILRAAQNAIKG